MTIYLRFLFIPILIFCFSSFAFGQLELENRTSETFNLDFISDHKAAYYIHKWVTEQKSKSRLSKLLLKERNSYLYQLDSAYSVTKTFTQGAVESTENASGYDYVSNSLDVSHSWIFNSSEQTPSSFGSMLYNTDDNLVHLQFDDWDGSYGSWEGKIPPTGVFYNYNEDGYLIDSEYAYVDSSDVLNHYVSSRFYYDSLFNLERVEYFSRATGWGLDTILLASTIDYRYDQYGLLLNSVSHQLRLPEFKWEDRDSVVYSYDALVRLEKMKQYSGPDTMRKPQLFETYFYLPNGKLDRRIIKKSYADSIFRSESIFKYAYHTYGSLRKITESLSYLGSPHEDFFKTEFWHDSTIVSDQVRFSRINNRLDPNIRYEQNHMITKMVVINLKPDVYHKPERFADFFYKQITPVSSVNIHEALDCKVYPVPAIDRIYLEWKDSTLKPTLATITNNQGQVVLTTSISHFDSDIDVSELTVGMYFVTLYDNDKRVVQKSFIKE